MTGREPGAGIRIGTLTAGANRCLGIGILPGCHDSLEVFTGVREAEGVDDGEYHVVVSRLLVDATSIRIAAVGDAEGGCEQSLGIARRGAAWCLCLPAHLAGRGIHG